MTRYSIRNCTASRLKDIGVKSADIRQTHTGSVMFATLSDDQAKKLQSEGCKLSKVSYIKTDHIKPSQVSDRQISTNQITAPEIPIPDYITQYEEYPSEGVAPPPYVEPPSQYTPSELIRAVGFEEYRQMMTPPLYGDGINIAVIDSGIRSTHENIGEASVIYTENFTDSDEGDFFDHGTGVAEIILTAAPMAKLLDLKIISNEGFGSSEDLVMAIDTCIALKDEGSNLAPRIINLSLGTEDDGDEDDPIRVVCREALERGIWIVAAAGNEGPEPNTIMNPGCEEYVLCVGSVSRAPIKINDFSSRGPTVNGITKPDMVFFGDSVKMASSVSDEAYTTKSGTSFSAPFISGIVALHIEAISKLGGYETVFPYEQMDERLRLLSTVQNFIDAYLEKISVKPTEDYVAAKDTVYGWGLPYGEYLSQSYYSTDTTTDISGIISPMITMMMVGMMFGMMNKVMV